MDLGIDGIRSVEENADSNGLESPYRPPLEARRQRRRMGLVPSSKVPCDALDRASPDSERPRHLQDTYTLRKLRSHLSFSRAVYLRPAELHPLGDGPLEAGLDLRVRERASWRRAIAVAS